MVSCGSTEWNVQEQQPPGAAGAGRPALVDVCTYAARLLLVSTWGATPERNDGAESLLHGGGHSTHADAGSMSCMVAG